MPFPLSLNVMPPGSAPVSVKEGVGVPVAVTVNVPVVPTANTALFALVMEGGAPEPLAAARKATICMIQAPPEITAVALWLPVVLTIWSSRMRSGINLIFLYSDAARRHS